LLSKESPMPRPVLFLSVLAILAGGIGTASDPRPRLPRVAPPDGGRDFPPGMREAAYQLFDAAFAQNTELPPSVRIDSGVSGHIHPALCVTKKGTLVAVYCKSEYQPYL